MPRPTPHLARNGDPRVPIGEVQILVYAWERGQSEIRVRFPNEALVDPATKTRFARLVMAELQRSLSTLGGPLSGPPSPGDQPDA